jgi:hypothetical protein
MGVGHLAASFALRGRLPRVPLFFLLAAAGFLDLLWGLAILSGIERAHIDTGTGSAVPLVLDSVPYSHSLPAALFWGMAVSLAWWLWRRDSSGALALGALVTSHWVLDFVSHVRDIPLLPSGPSLGLGLWRSLPATLVVELGMLWAGLALYAHTTTEKDRIGWGGLLMFGAVVTIMGGGAYLGPPPRSVLPLAVLNVAVLLPLLLMEWIDRHRRIVA